MDCHDCANGGEATSRWLAVFPPPVIVERVFNPDRKDTHWGKRKLKRDR
jgi:hypothetical protein